MTKSVELMQVKYEATWIVIAGRKEFVLTDSQIDLLKKADLAGQRGIVWFDTFAISIPHIEAIYVKTVKQDGEIKEYEETYRDDGIVVYKEKTK